MKKKVLIPCLSVIVVFVISMIVYTDIQRKHTIKLINISQTTVKYEQIQ